MDSWPDMKTTGLPSQAFILTYQNAMIQMNDPRRCLSSAGVVLERTRTVPMQDLSVQLFACGIDIIFQYPGNLKLTQH